MSRPELPEGWRCTGSGYVGPDGSVRWVSDDEVEVTDGDGFADAPAAVLRALLAPTEAAPDDDVRELLAAWDAPGGLRDNPDKLFRLGTAIERLRARYGKVTP